MHTVQYISECSFHCLPECKSIFSCYACLVTNTRCTVNWHLLYFWFVVSCIDGHSRKIIWLECSSTTSWSRYVTRNFMIVQQISMLNVTRHVCGETAECRKLYFLVMLLISMCILLILLTSVNLPVTASWLLSPKQVLLCALVFTCIDIHMVTQANLEMKNFSHTEYIFASVSFTGWTYASCRENYQSTRCHWGPKKRLQSLVGQVFEHLVMNVIWSEPPSEWVSSFLTAHQHRKAI